MAFTRCFNLKACTLPFSLSIGAAEGHAGFTAKVDELLYVKKINSILFAPLSGSSQTIQLYLIYSTSRMSEEL